MNNKNELMCNSIRFRNLSLEVSEAIKQLISNGADVNHQDVNNNNNTSIHFATINRDLNAVKFLLECKPDLTIKNNDDETAEDLARAFKADEILCVLFNHRHRTEEFISKSFVCEFELSKISQRKLKVATENSNFKILKITNLKRLKEKKFKSIFVSSSHLFVIIIETNETFLQFSQPQTFILSSIFNKERPVILQINSTANQIFKIFLKSQQKAEFIEIKSNEVIDNGAFVSLLANKLTCNLQTLLRGLKSSIFGSFNGDILHAKLKIDANLELIAKVIAKNDSLCLRFLKLFDRNFIEAAGFECLENDGCEGLLALLDFPLMKNDEIKLNQKNKKLLNVEDENGENLLMAAIERENFEAFKILIKCGIDVNHRNKKDETATDLAWNEKLFDYLLELLKSDSIFPKDFDVLMINQENLHGEIEELINERKLFHDAIRNHVRNGSIGEVKSFIDKNPQIKTAYDLKNKSALTIALESKQFEKYSLLRSKEFSSGADEDFQI
jgi:ankyrin repeat protein